MSFTSDPLARYQVGACNVQVVPGEARTLTFTSLLELTSTSATEWSAVIPSRGIVLPCEADDDDLVVTFDADATYRGVGQHWTLYHDDRSALAGTIVPTRPEAAPTGGPMEVVVGESTTITVSVVSAAPFSVAAAVDVDVSTPPTDGQVLTWNGESLVWNPATPAATTSPGESHSALVAVASSTDVTGGAFTTFVPVDEYGAEVNPDTPLSRATYAGNRILLVDGDNAAIWLLTASGPCTLVDPQPTTGDVVGVTLPNPVVYVGTGYPNATAAAYGTYHYTTPSRFMPFASLGVHVGQTGQDGVDDYLVPDPDNTRIDSPGSRYDGMLIWRTDATTLQGNAVGTLNGVCRLTAQTDATIGEFPDADPDYFAVGARNGTMEVFHDQLGITGQFWVRTVDWNTFAFRDASLLSGTVFLNGVDNSLWATSGDGMASDSTPVSGGDVLALGETSTTAYRGDRGKTAYDHSLVTSGNPHGVTKSDVGLSSVTNDVQLKAADLDTDSTLAANSDSKIPSQKAVKSHVATAAAATYGSLSFGFSAMYAVGTTVSGTWAQSVSGVAIPQATQSSSPANTDYVQIPNVPLGGTYSIGLGHVKGTDCGQIQLSIDGSTVGSAVDAYAASAAFENATVATGVSITPGVHTVKLAVPNKNVTSTSYRARLCTLTFTRTA